MNQTEPIPPGRGLPLCDGRSTEIFTKMLKKADLAIAPEILSMISLKMSDENRWNDGQRH
jgi:hypothetical protein